MVRMNRREALRNMAFSVPLLIVSRFPASLISWNGDNESPDEYEMFLQAKNDVSGSKTRDAYLNHIWENRRSLVSYAKKLRYIVDASTSDLISVNLEFQKIGKQKKEPIDVFDSFFEKLKKDEGDLTLLYGNSTCRRICDGIGKDEKYDLSGLAYDGIKRDMITLAASCETIDDMHSMWMEQGDEFYDKISLDFFCTVYMKYSDSGKNLSNFLANDVYAGEYEREIVMDHLGNYGGMIKKAEEIIKSIPGLRSARTEIYI